MVDLPQMDDDIPLSDLEAVLEARSVRGKTKLLVEWIGRSEDETTWQQLHLFKQFFPKFQLEDTSSRRREMSWLSNVLVDAHVKWPQVSGLEGQ